MKKARHTPLHVELNEDAELSKFGRISSKAVKKQQQRDKKTNTDGGREGLEGGLRDGRASAAETDVDLGQGRVETARMSRKILDLARRQQEEMAAEDSDNEEQESGMRITGAVPRKETGKSARDAMEDEDEDEDDAFSGVEEDEEEEYAELASTGFALDVNFANNFSFLVSSRKSIQRTMKHSQRSAGTRTCSHLNCTRISHRFQQPVRIPRQRQIYWIA